MIWITQVMREASKMKGNVLKGGRKESLSQKSTVQETSTNTIDTLV